MLDFHDWLRKQNDEEIEWLVIEHGDVSTAYNEYVREYKKEFEDFVSTL